MCCSGSEGGTRMTRCGLLCGMAALAALTAALLGPAWLHTEERLPHLPRHLAGLVSVKFKLGLFRACPKIIKPANLSTYITIPACSTIRYKSLDDVNATELGFQRLEFTPIVVSKMRISTPFQVAAAALILAGTISALIGHCCSDHRTLVACGLYLLGGLSLGGGLIVLASLLSDATWDIPQTYSSFDKSEDTGLPHWHYGWCLQLSGLALILSELAALLTISGYMARFPTVEDMVRVMVPGAERKLREQRGLSSEYLVRSHQKSPGPPPGSGTNQPTKGEGPPRLTEEGTSLLCKSAPDICASNPQSAISYVDKADLSHMLPAYPETKIIEPRFVGTGFPDKADQNIVDSRLSGFVDKEGLVIAFAEGKEQLACQEPPARFSDFPPPPLPLPTEQQQQQQQQPITPQQQPPLAFADKDTHGFIVEQQTADQSLLDAPYGYDTRYNSLAGQTVPITLKHHHQATVSVSAIQSSPTPQYVYQNFGTIHSGMLRVAEPGTSSTMSSNCSSQRSMTLQNPKRKVTGGAPIAQNAFSTLECERRRRTGGGGGGGASTTAAMAASGKANFCAGSAV
ncbi:uncharacterized protein LOC131667935 [Phymastichus coffea]|uniref:uncharacterized protein LOC131667935 n=1 Tax=Phymastichus coffea TaxID=108790 RepID=UPI00273B76F7|nr:uncharacterized protein LOC131667935 [Phymastichus coffea]XP_058797695.1 uncharacterized protein LOC131667935 [Phymastichus coffea]